MDSIVGYIIFVCIFFIILETMGVRSAEKMREKRWQEEENKLPHKKLELVQDKLGKELQKAYNKRSFSARFSCWLEQEFPNLYNGIKYLKS
jgi:hypothetical protein